jgi:hypothetical protein
MVFENFRAAPPRAPEFLVLSGAPPVQRNLEAGSLVQSRVVFRLVVAASTDRGGCSIHKMITRSPGMRNEPDPNAVELSTQTPDWLGPLAPPIPETVKIEVSSHLLIVALVALWIWRQSSKGGTRRKE